MDVTLRAGVAEATITPPLGIRLSGYGGRDAPAETVHDDLRCQALVLELDGARLALIACDLIGLSVPLAHLWRAEIAAQLGLPEAHALLSCTHTHAGPATRALREVPTAREAAYLENLKHSLIGAAETAAARLTPARLRLAGGRLRTQRNRRDRLEGEHGPLDDALGVLRIDRTGDGSPLGLVVNYACHPVALRDNNLGFSADYVGWLRQTVRGATGAPCLFLQGAAGELIPDASPPSIDDRAKGFPADVPRQIAFARRFGDRIGVEAVRIARDASEVDVPLLSGRTATFRASFEGSEESVAFEVQALRLGPLAIVGLPVEPLNALGLALRDLASPTGPSAVWCAGYANGCYGYLPVREEYVRGGYEVGSAHRYYGRPGPFAPDTAERVLAGAAEQIATLWHTNKEHHDPS